MRAYPDFVVIGAMKSASTSLAELLSGHPDACMADPKEPGFFSRDERFASGEDWYLRFFRQAVPGQRIGEASTCYSRAMEYPHAARRLYEFNPRAKLIYIVRDPVRRTYSHYVHEMQERMAQNRDAAIPTFAEALDTCPELLDASNYFRQIDHYLSCFPVEQIYCIVLEELISNPEQEYSSLCEFLGLAEPEDQKPIKFGVHNVAGSALAEASSRDVVESATAKLPPFVRRFVPAQYRQVMRNFLIASLSQKMLKKERSFMSSKLSPYSDEDRARVRSRLAGTVGRLERFLGREISAWSV